MDLYNWICTSFYDWACTVIWHNAVELVMFVLVDAVAKSTLRDTINDEEKRTIWMYESIVLAFLCTAVLYSHHTPYLLILLTSLTFVYTQMVGRPRWTNFVADLRAHWDNHFQHEESMKQIEMQRNIQQQQQQLQNFGMAGVPGADVNNLSGHNTDNSSYGFNFPFLKQPSLQYPPNATVVPGLETPAYSLKPSTEALIKHRPGLYPAYGRAWGSSANNSYSSVETGQLLNSAYNNAANVQVVSSNVGTYNSAVPSQNINPNNRKSFTSQQNLQRRSLHSDKGTKLPSKLPVASSIKSKVINALGIGQSSSKPIGLVNHGENVCFINSVVQCLARGPYLVENLTAIAAKELECTVFESQLLSSLAELLDILTLPPDEAQQSVYSVAKFRKACSNLHPKLVTSPGQFMRQQDAAEFLMWLLATLHDILNKNRRALNYDSSNGDKFSSPRLTDLKLVYGDLTANRVHELKDQCKQDIAAAHGLENESYAEAVQRLSDLEWLIYKQANDSLIDSLFTGQLVEAYFSVTYGNISVNLQTFNVLPVPIGEPKNLSGLVMLDDCFDRFCNLENLSESSGIGGNEQTPSYQPNEHTHKTVHASKHFASTPNTLSNIRLAQQSDVTCMPSPIHHVVSQLPAGSTNLTSPSISQTYATSTPRPSFIRNNIASDGSFIDNAFKTSTPVVRDSKMVQPKEHIQRRCLLRQLPECLVIQLMRFNYDPAAGLATKINTSVSIRLREFNLRNAIYDTVMQRSDMTAPSAGYVYELYGLCLHLGADSTSYGHYVSYCMDKGRWYRMDDHIVTEVNMEYQLNTEEIRQNAYLLFYRRTSSASV